MNRDYDHDYNGGDCDWDGDGHGNYGDDSDDSDDGDDGDDEGVKCDSRHRTINIIATLHGLLPHVHARWHSLRAIDRQIDCNTMKMLECQNRLFRAAGEKHVTCTSEAKILHSSSSSRFKLLLHGTHTLPVHRLVWKCGSV